MLQNFVQKLTLRLEYVFPINMCPNIQPLRAAAIRSRPKNSVYLKILHENVLQWTKKLFIHFFKM